MKLVRKNAHHATSCKLNVFYHNGGRLKKVAQCLKDHFLFLKSPFWKINPLRPSPWNRKQLRFLQRLRFTAQRPSIPMINKIQFYNKPEKGLRPAKNCQFIKIVTRMLSRRSLEPYLPYLLIKMILDMLIRRFRSMALKRKKSMDSLPNAGKNPLLKLPGISLRLWRENRP